MIDHSSMDESAAKWPFLKKILFALFILGALAVLVDATKNTFFGNLVKAGYNFLAAPANSISSNNGRVNILVMGKAGGSHEGPDLTDTMMLVSVSLKKPDIVIVSIPRDIWIPEIRAKINSAYYWGNQNTPYFGNLKSSTGGINFAKSMAGKITGTPIQYGIVIDLSSFKDIIDALGGIEVNVENSFTDKLYPVAGRENDTCNGDPAYSCRYETVTFSAGMQKMDGERALKFIRSRHAEGVEGTDTAREARQQKVIDAIKNRISKPKVFLSPAVDLAMINVVKKYIETDISLPAAGSLARKVVSGSKNIKQYLIPEDLLVNPPAGKAYDNLYVFVPKAGNGKWEEINKWFSLVINN